jgi:hypothetical protein
MTPNIGYCNKDDGQYNIHLCTCLQGARLMGTWLFMAFDIFHGCNGCPAAVMVPMQGDLAQVGTCLLVLLMHLPPLLLSQGQGLWIGLEECCMSYEVDTVQRRTFSTASMS